jgi:hypothetical protein
VRHEPPNAEQGLTDGQILMRACLLVPFDVPSAVGRVDAEHSAGVVVKGGREAVP